MHLFAVKVHPFSYIFIHCLLLFVHCQLLFVHLLVVIFSLLFISSFLYSQSIRHLYIHFLVYVSIKLTHFLYVSIDQFIRPFINNLIYVSIHLKSMCLLHRTRQVGSCQQVYHIVVSLYIMITLKWPNTLGLILIRLLIRGTSLSSGKMKITVNTLIKGASSI